MALAGGSSGCFNMARLIFFVRFWCLFLLEILLGLRLSHVFACIFWSGYYSAFCAFPPLVHDAGHSVYFPWVWPCISLLRFWVPGVSFDGEDFTLRFFGPLRT